MQGSIEKKLSDEIGQVVSCFFKGFLTKTKLNLTEKLLTQFNLDEEELEKVINECFDHNIDDGFGTENSQKTTKSLKTSKSSKTQKKTLEPVENKKEPSKRRPRAKKDEVVHFCVGILKLKNEPCGKKATTEVEGKFYCGIHAKSAGKPLEQNSKNSKNTKTTKKPGKKSDSVDKKDSTEGELRSLPTKKGTVKENAKKNDRKVHELLKKVIKPLSVLNLVEVNGRRMDKATRILIEDGKAYGKLDLEEEDLINPLEEDDIKFLEANGIDQCTIPMISKDIELMLELEDESDLDCVGEDCVGEDCVGEDCVGDVKNDGNDEVVKDEHTEKDDDIEINLEDNLEEDKLESGENEENDGKDGNEENKEECNSSESDEDN